MKKFRCSICGFVYDEAIGIPERNIPPGTKWEDVPEDFTCPVCAAPKTMFMAMEDESQASVSSGAAVPSSEAVPSSNAGLVEKIGELSAEELSAICSSLAKGCEKQRLGSEMEAFHELAAYFKAKADTGKGKTFKDAEAMLAQDISTGYPAANNAAKAKEDRGALRSLVWSEKVSAMMKSLLDRFDKEGEAMLADTKIFVCDICGFIYLGDAPPEICPVCKVPHYKIFQVERS